MKASPFTELLDALRRQRGVTAALIVSEADGLVVDSHLSVGMKGDVVAAVSASL